MLEDSAQSIKIVSIDKFVDDKLSSENDITEEEEENEQANAEFKSNLASYIIEQFAINRDAKRSSGIEEDILDSLRAYNGTYNPEDKARMALDTQGSQLFMNLTATKSRAAKSWIADIELPAIGRAWEFRPSSAIDLPLEATQTIEAAISKEFDALTKKVTNDGAGQGQQPPTAEVAQESIREINQRKRDVKDAIQSEIEKEAKFQLKLMEQQVADQLEEGHWEDALLDFLDDFTIYPTAFMKGPIISKRKRLTWVGGQPKEIEDFVFKNKRVDPLDMYPSPGATLITDGKLCEHVRYHADDLNALIGVPGYDTEKIEEIIENDVESFYSLFVNSGVESTKADEERRGNDTDANRDIFHGIHFFGAVPKDIVEEWGTPCEEVEGNVVEVEALLVNGEVIKCSLNDDPLLRRPYYKASYANRPGAFWGRSLPQLMKDIQRMCNAVARSLANNLALSSGPQGVIKIDQLADNGDIEELRPFKLWQVVSDPSGTGGRPIEFFNIPSNAAELLKVYAEFEIRADDATGVPRIAHGNDSTAGASSTATGLAILLESASKIIKDAIRNIDKGLIKPRLEYQFYWNLIKNNDTLNFTGDVNVVPLGTAALTVRAAETLRRNEFLNITANPVDQAIMGAGGRAAILKSMSEDLNLPVDVIPGPLDLRKKEDEQKAQAKQQQEALAQKEQADRENSLQATKIQIDGQERMHSGTLQLKVQELQAKIKSLEEDKQIQIAKLQQDGLKEAAKHNNSIEVTKLKEDGATSRQVREVSLTLSGAKKSDGI